MIEIMIAVSSILRVPGIAAVMFAVISTLPLTSADGREGPEPQERKTDGRLLQTSSETAATTNRDLLSELQTSPHRILYEAYDRNNWELFVMNADGSGKTNLTNTPEVHEMFPQASVDGSKICFVADHQQSDATQRSVWFMNFDGSGRVKVATQARQPFWHADGTKIAFLAQEFPRFSV